MEQDAPGRHDLVHKIEIPDVARQDGTATLQGVQIEGGVIQGGHLLAGLEATEPENQSRQDADFTDAGIQQRRRSGK